MPHSLLSSLSPFSLSQVLASVAITSQPPFSDRRLSQAFDPTLFALSALATSTPFSLPVSEHAKSPMLHLIPITRPRHLHTPLAHTVRLPVKSNRRPLRSTPGAYVLGHWIPFDVWPRIAAHLTAVIDQVAFQSVCVASYAAVQSLQSTRLRHVCATFRLARFILPSDMVDKVLMVHAVPPRADTLVLFLDESDAGRGVEIAWIRSGRIRRAPLGLEGVPATSASNIVFAPDASRLACLVTLAHDTPPPDHLDPLHRLRGWERVSRSHGHVVDIVYDPCEDCTLQVVDLIADTNGSPHHLHVHTFSHVFVPEYGFDMVWRPDPDGGLELVFAAMLHSIAGAATYLVRWRGFCSITSSGSSNRPRPNFAFMACIDGASSELLHDKRRAMLTQTSTTCTSRIELSNDARSIFFDTVSKFGILRFDQVVDSATTRVTRADLPNSPRLSTISTNGAKYLNSDVEERAAHRALSQLNVGNLNETRVSNGLRPFEESTRVNRMSPDGVLLCSIVCIGAAGILLNPGEHARHLEMRSSVTGRLIYRRLILRTWQDESSQGSHPQYYSLLFDKSVDAAQHTLAFSSDSSILVLWDCYLSCTHIVFSQRLPLILDAKSGRVIQDFSCLSRIMQYEFTQIAPDALTVYGTRMCADRILMDAIDVLSGSIIKTVIVTGPIVVPKQFSSHASFLVHENVLHTVSRGWVDALWQTTRSSLGCGWSGRKRLDEHEEYGDLLEDGTDPSSMDVR